MGEALAGRRLGRKAMLIGAVTQSLPDIDFIHALWMDPASNLLAHRGFTHSLLFAVLITVLLSALAGRFYRKGGMQWRHWILLIGVEIAVHLLLDVCNQYGMGLLEPFSHQRFSVNAIFVADPFFSLVPFMATLVLLLKKKDRRQRGYWWGLGLIVPALYLLYCFVNKYRIDEATREDLAAQQISFDQYFTTPTPFNNWLWYTVAGDSTGFYVAHRSALYPKQKLRYHFFPRNEQLLKGMKEGKEVQLLIRFSQGFYTLEQWHDTLVFNDLRFGQIVGWHDPGERFVFHYFLLPTDADNRLVVQRGRFARWSRATTASMLQRIRGR